MNYTKYKNYYGIIILSITASVLGLILIFQPESSMADRLFGFNCFCGGAIITYLKLTKNMTLKQLDSALLVYTVIFTAYQCWCILVIYIFVPEKQKKIIHKICALYFIILGISVIFNIIKSL